MKINLLTVTWLTACCDLILGFRQHHFQNPSSSNTEFQLKSIVQFGYHKTPSKSLKLTGKSTNSILSILDLEDSSEEEYGTQNLDKFHIDEDAIWSEDSAYSTFANDLKIPRKDPGKDLVYRRAVLNLAKMAGHAYKPQPKKPWKDLDPGWNVNASFGWDEDRIRGYVFGNTENTKLIVAIKGTTFNFLGFSKSFIGGMFSPIGRNDRTMVIFVHIHYI
jgi:putative lipase involved disintegration of autophagic bodies